MAITRPVLEPSDRVDSAVAAQPAGWIEIPASDAPSWNECLRHTDAQLYQYPYWNEAYKRAGVNAVCMCWMMSGQPHAYICILSIGFGRMKIGLVMRGPVWFGAAADSFTRAIRDLREWAATAGYIFLRFTHSDPALLDQITSAVGPCRRLDAFPFHIDRSVTMNDLVIDQKADDREMLNGFDREARRKIRRAGEVGYEIRVGASLSDLNELWPLFLTFFERKKIRFNLPLEGVLDAVRAAEPYDCVRIYSAWIEGRPVEALLVFRDRMTALCHFAALDVEALAGRASPSVLLHWVAMRDMYRLGAMRYNLEAGTGTLWQFKQQFRPRLITYPSPVTLIINRPLYRLWSVVSLICFRFIKRCARWIILHGARNSAWGRERRCRR